MKIIAVDDEKLALDTLVDSIEKAVPDASITGFRKPDDALQFIRENDCEIAFLDIKMRGMTGLELAKRQMCIRDRHKGSDGKAVYGTVVLIIPVESDYWYLVVDDGDIMGRPYYESELTPVGGGGINPEICKSIM